jgi:carboxymethylenebutenolidase
MAGERIDGCYLRGPASGTGPSLLLLAERIDDVARRAADLFAEEGYEVMAFDAAHVPKAHTSLGLRPGTGGKVAVLGGPGAVALAEGPVDAACLFLPAQVPDLSRIRCPASVHVAGGEVPALRDLAASRPDFSVHFYPDAAPDFYFAGSPGYHRPSAQLAHSRVLALLRRSVGPRFDLEALWERHLWFEFDRRDPEGTMTTMVADPVNMNVPVMTGGVGHDGVLRYYREQFLGQMPADCRVVPVSRVVGSDRLVDEHLLCFTHDRVMDAMLPGLAPTGKYVELAMVVIVQFRGDKVAGEHIYWDQASLLAQVGALDPGRLPIGGRDNARKLLDETILAGRLAQGRVT